MPKWLRGGLVSSFRALQAPYLKIVLPLGLAFYLLALIFAWGIRGVALDLIPSLARLSALLHDAPRTGAFELGLAESIRNLAYALAALLGALAVLAMVPFRLIKAWVEERTAQAAEQGLITSRITQAVEQLGAEKTVKKISRRPVWKRDAEGNIARNSDGAPQQETDAEGAGISEEHPVETTEPNLEVRLGALYALERIAQDSLRDHVPIMETLCAYIRENSENLDEPARPRIDILTALTILGRRGPDQRAQEAKRTPPYRPDLGGAKFERNDLRGLALQGIPFVEARMQGADLSWAKMEGADLRGARMEGANLSWAEMEGAHLSRAEMEGANLRGAEMEGANLRVFSLSSLDCTSVQLAGAAVQSMAASEVFQIRPDQAVEIFADGSVILPDGKGFERPAHWCAEKLQVVAFHSRWRDWRERKGLPWPPPGPALAWLDTLAARPFDSPVQPHEIDPDWTPPAR